MRLTIKGAGEQAKGKVREVAGNSKLEIEGKADHAQGRFRTYWWHQRHASFDAGESGWVWRRHPLLPLVMGTVAY
jgi:hypothetical protein